MTQPTNKLRITLYQQDIVWENKTKNLQKIELAIASKAPETDLFVLPEMCTTGFSMNSKNLAENNNGQTITELKRMAKDYNIAICGSFIASQNNKYFNRAFFITEDHYYSYDKRHLFRMGEEAEHFSAGKHKLIIEHKGFNICLLVCYDLRFPVWSRNVDNEYDLLIYVASWPQPRIKAWNTLLPARAIENMCYVCGVNRVGTDGNKLVYDGNSKVFNARGEDILSTSLNLECTKTVSIDKEELIKFRNKFPVWKDADKFEIK